MTPNRYTGKARGAALIIAMLLTALGAAVAAQLIQPLAGWLKREYTARDVQAAYTLADAATGWSLTVLAGDARTSSIDHYGELWATKLPATQIEGGMVDGQLNDLQSRFNLNSVAPRGVRNVANIALAARLFASVNVPENLAEVLADAVDRDDVVADQTQREATQYGRLLRNRPIDALTDLLEMPGFTQSHVEALATLVEVLPEATPINANTADLNLLRVALPQASAEGFAKMSAQRAQRPFNSVAEFSTALGVAAPEGMFSVSSSYFSMTAQVRFEHAAHRLQLRISRIAGAAPKVISRRITNAT
ncbi:MAG: general secretion pathway protein GspK [Betaproteobacteria bacterium]|nr:MAG: general secretion pathway protein GspK [Betaproteobacteria bacterium]TAG50160.1 MAG: general secretion pathway protein GspK [Betaproteobacteria bacterium]